MANESAHQGLGTGSGSFSHSLARSVGNQGKVHSFEYHQERYAKALYVTPPLTLLIKHRLREGYEGSNSSNMDFQRSFL